ncbi:MAG: DUF2784 domain-containing protein [bacterium]
MASKSVTWLRMPDSSSTLPLADVVLTVHVVFVLFVVLGLPLIWIGASRQWNWVRNFGFRLGHIVAIGIVVVQAWIGALCPLTTMEMQLRRRAGQQVYEQSFIQHWLQKLLYYDAPLWVFGTLYSLFGAAVLLSWIFIPPKLRR